MKKTDGVKYTPDLPLIEQAEAVLKDAGLESSDYLKNLKWIKPGVEHLDNECQREAINDALRIEIGRHTENTMEVRRCLINDGSHADWLRLLKSEVAPCLLQQNTPVKTP